ncbi:MAG: carbamoyl phosphate synthase large subunit, partial [Wolbachia sp.]
TGYDLWFLQNIQQIILAEQKIKENGLPETAYEMLELKKMGFSDARLAKLSNKKVEQIEAMRKKFGVNPVYKRVDTCAAEFESSTAYMYGCYEGDVENKTECEANISDRKKVVILGSGPNRIGQGIEFDYACVHAASAAKEMGYETIMINCNPETVSTDYDTADRLYFAPLIAEDVLEILSKEQENGTLVGVIVQIGGQTPLKLAKVLNERGFKILGTSFDSIDLAEDRMRFKNLALQLNLKQPENSICHSVKEALINAEKVGFPLVVRPSYVLGGQSMSIRHDTQSFKEYVLNQTKIFEHGSLLLDKFLVNAVEVDVDAVCDGKKVFIAAVMEHIEEAGIHSGDSTCSIPTNTLSDEVIKEIELQTERIALALEVKGLINIQFAVQESDV